MPTRLSLLLCLLVATPAFAQQTVTISQPPPTAAAGTSFMVTDTVWNPGTTPSPGRTQQFWLLTVPAGPVIPIGTRAVPGLAPGALSTVSTNLTIPANSPAATYVLGVGGPGCAAPCLKATSAIAVSSAMGNGQNGGQGNGGQGNSGGQGGPITVRIVVDGPAKVTGGVDGQQPAFTNCSTNCVMSGPAGAAFSVNVTPGTVQGNPPFGQSRQATFAGWSGANCNPQFLPGQNTSGTTYMRWVPTTSITCTVKFQ